MSSFTRLFLVGILVFTVPGFAAGISGNDAGPNPLPSKIVKLIESEQYELAMKELTAFVKKERRNADAWNWLGYSQRTLGDLDSSLNSYNKALKIKRKHLGANEYLGELYVMRGEFDKAKNQLNKLKKYCGECEEYLKLEEVIKNTESG